MLDSSRSFATNRLSWDSLAERAAHVFSKLVHFMCSASAACVDHLTRLCLLVTMYLFDVAACILLDSLI